MVKFDRVLRGQTPPLEGFGEASFRASKTGVTRPLHEKMHMLVCTLLESFRPPPRAQVFAN